MRFGVNILRGKRSPLLADSGMLAQVDEGVDHSRDALMGHPYKVLVMAMQFINFKKRCQTQAKSTYPTITKTLKLSQ